MSDLAKRPDLRSLVASAAHYAQSTIADTTRLTYTREFKQFAAWCEEMQLPSLPSSPEVVALFLTALAEGLVVTRWKDRGGRPRSSQVVHRYGALQHMYQSIIWAHCQAGHDWPQADARITKVLRGIAFRHGTKKKKVDPLQVDDLRKCMVMLRERRTDDLVPVRDKAILSLGFFGAFRRIEIAQLKVEDIELVDEGLIVTVRRSKRDQLAVGTTVYIVRQGDPDVCPVLAMQRYLEVSGLKSGPLFRRIDPRSDMMGDKHMIPQSIANVIKDVTDRAGLDPEKVFSGHSLRAGFATTAAVKGRSLPQIMRQGRWTDERTARGYIRPATGWQDNPTANLSEDEDVGVKKRTPR